MFNLQSIPRLFLAAAVATAFSAVATAFSAGAAMAMQAAPINQADGGAAAAQGDAKPGGTQQQIDAIYKELVRMIPGGLPADSPQSKALRNIVSQFGNRQAKEASESLQALVEAEANFPPSNVLLAALAYAAKDQNAGQQLLEKAALDTPDYPDVYFSFARVAMNQRRFTDADIQAEYGLLKLNNGQFTAEQISYFQQRYYEIKFQVSKTRGKLEGAKEALAALMELAPESAQALVGSAEIAFEAGDFASAKSFLTKLAEVSDREIQLPEITIATWLQRKNRIDEANTLIRTASRENPTNENAQIYAARWFLNREDFRLALGAVKNLEENAGESNFTREVRGKVSFAQGAYGLAEQQFTKLNKDNPTNIEFANMYALTLLQSTEETKRKQGLQLAQRVAGARSDNPVALSTLGFGLLKMGDTENSRKIMARVAQLKRNTPDTSYILAAMLAQTGQPEQAAKILQVALSRKNTLFLFRSEAEGLAAELKKSTDQLPE